jgi:hypothetical protein
MKMVILQKVIYLFNAIPTKIPRTFFTEIEKLIKSSYGRTKVSHLRSQISKAILNKKFNAGGITISDFKLSYETITIRTTWLAEKQTRAH